MINVPNMNQIHVLDRRLPLIALRAFEAFARLGSVAAAAQELSITASAVSHQLKVLETYLDVDLTERIGRNLELTHSGRRYFEGISMGFSVIQTSTEQISENDRIKRIQISSLNLIATSWLLPALATFTKQNPNIQFDIQYTRYRNYTSDAADLSIRFGSGRWTGYDSYMVMPGDAFPVASAGFLREYGTVSSAQDIANMPLIHDGKVEAWRNWFLARGVSSQPLSPSCVCEDGMLVLGSIRANLGVALIRPLLVERELETGEFQIISSESITDGQDYFLSMPSGRESSPEMRKLMRWLLNRRRTADDVKEIVLKYK